MKKSILILFLLCMVSCASCSVQKSEDSHTKVTSETNEITTISQLSVISEEVENKQTSNVSEVGEAELKEFDIYDIQFTLDDCADVDIEFLNEEQKHTFILATFVYMTLDLDGDMFFRYNNIRPVYNSEIYMCHTGFTYESVMNGFKSVLSENILNTKFKGCCSNLNGEFLCYDGARGTSADFDFIKGFIPVEITDKKVVFQIVASYSNPETFESIGESTFNFEMVLVDNHWVMTQYEFWK